MPDSTRPDGSTLTESDADRLSERFTASWDAPPEPQVEAAPVAVAAAEPARPVLKPKHTLLGMAPIVVGEPSSGTAPVPGAVPMAVAATSASAAPTSSAAPPSSPSSAIQAFTTPSKPYVPKDDPSTPAVVIAESVLPPAERARALSAQTIPGQTGGVGRAAPAPFATTTPEASTTADTYPPARRSSKLPVFLAAVGVAGLVVVAAVTLSGGSDEAARPKDAVGGPAAPEPAASEAPAPAAEASPSQPVASTPAAAVVSPAPGQPLVEEDAAPKKTRGKLRPGAPASRRPAVRPQPRAVPVAAAAVPSPEPAPAAAVPVPAPPPEPAPATPAPAKPSKSVIVRETPF